MIKRLELHGLERAEDGRRLPVYAARQLSPDGVTLFAFPR